MKKEISKKKWFKGFAKNEYLSIWYVATLPSKKNHLQFKTHLGLFIWGFMGQNKDIFLENDVEIQFLEYLIAQNCTLLYPLLILFFWQTSKFLENSGVFVSGPGVLLVVRSNDKRSPELSKQCVENFQLLHLHKKTRSKLTNSVYTYTTLDTNCTQD